MDPLASLIADGSGDDERHVQPSYGGGREVRTLGCHQVQHAADDAGVGIQLEPASCHGCERGRANVFLCQREEGADNLAQPRRGSRSELAQRYE